MNSNVNVGCNKNTRIKLRIARDSTTCKIRFERRRFVGMLVAKLFSKTLLYYLYIKILDFVWHAHVT
jgi:hypothetical protein